MHAACIELGVWTVGMLRRRPRATSRPGNNLLDTVSC